MKAARFRIRTLLILVAIVAIAAYTAKVLVFSGQQRLLARSLSAQEAAATSEIYRMVRVAGQNSRTMALAEELKRLSKLREAHDRAARSPWLLGEPSPPR